MTKKKNYQYCNIQEENHLVSKIFYKYKLSFKLKIIRADMSVPSVGMDVTMDLSFLPADVREKLAELDLELSEGNLVVFNYRFC